MAAQLESVGQAKIFNLEQFHAFVQTKPALLYPAFQLQQQMRRAVLGEKFWEKMAQKRIRLSVNQNKFITIASVSRMVSELHWNIPYDNSDSLSLSECEYQQPH